MGWAAKIFNKKKEFKPDLRGIDTESKPLGYLNPLFKVNVYSPNGKLLISIPFLFLVHTYLKDYGFKPENNISPSLTVGLNTGSGEIKMPMFIKFNAGLDTSYTPEEAKMKGLIL